MVGVFSVSVALSLSVQNDTECHKRVSDAVSSGGKMWSAMPVHLEKTLLAVTQAFCLRTHALPIFLNIQRLAFPRPATRAGQQCSQFCGICKCWILSKPQGGDVGQEQQNLRGRRGPRTTEIKTQPGLLVAQRCAAPSRQPSGASATTASFSTTAVGAPPPYFFGCPFRAFLHFFGSGACVCAVCVSISGSSFFLVFFFFFFFFVVYSFFFSLFLLACLLAGWLACFPFNSLFGQDNSFTAF